MKKNLSQLFCMMLAAMVAFTACKKNVELPTDPKPHPKPVPNAEDVAMINIKLQAVITIGAITYDSIPATFHITSWDANGGIHERDTTLAAGVNKVPVPKDHSRYRLSMGKWGITDTIELSKAELEQEVIYTLGGGKAARMLQKEESFLHVMGEWQPRGKTVYSYNTHGVKEALYYQKLPQYADLQFTQKHMYTHTFNKVTKIQVTDPHNKSLGSSTFEYNPQWSQITHMHIVKLSGETYGSVEYSSGEIEINYLFDNGHAMEYKQTFQKGNRVQDGAITSTNGSEGGTYQYDLNINPYAHMNMPDMYLSNLSKNNRIGQQKGYGGGFPVAEPYKFDYTYDAEGYPRELITYYKNYLTKEDIYSIKTVYTY